MTCPLYVLSSVTSVTQLHFPMFRVVTASVTDSMCHRLRIECKSLWLKDCYRCDRSKVTTALGERQR